MPIGDFLGVRLLLLKPYFPLFVNLVEW
jgi:hypothetical protein